MNKPKVFVTRMIFEEFLDILSREVELEVWPEEHPPSPEILQNKIRTVEGVLTNLMDNMDKKTIGMAQNLRVISQIAVGFDNIDLFEATRRRIPVGYTPDVVSEATADHAFGLLIAAARRLNESERWVRKGEWQIAFHPQHWLGSEVNNSTLGIIGLGRIGIEVAKRAKAFNMKILHNSRSSKPDYETAYNIKYVSLDTLLMESDFITLHVPLNNNTRHLIGEAELKLMQTNAILINTSRGGLVDPKALYRSLKEGWIKGAALDVTDPEPIPINHPLLTLENLIVTPHLGTATIQTRKKMCEIATQNLLAGLKHQRLPWCANPEVYMDA